MRLHRILSSHSLRRPASRSMLLSGFVFCLAGSGCDAGVFEFIDAVLEGGCQNNGGCSGQNTSGANTQGVSSTSPTHTSCGATGGSSDQGSTDQSEDTTSQTSALCSDGQVRTQPCEKCGTQRQRCEKGQWVDQGSCEGRRTCEPGELYTIRPPQGIFDCGSYRKVFRCDETCRPRVDVKTIFVSSCTPSDCCGSALGVRVACLDPKNLPEGGFCRSSAPSKEVIGDTWMTGEMWEKYRVSHGLAPK